MRKLATLFIVCLSWGVLAQDPDSTRTEPVEKTEDNSPKIIYYQTTPDEEIKYPKRKKEGVKTISGSMNHSGGFGALSFRMTEFRDKTMVLGGFRGGWIINRTLGIGVEGHGIIPTAKYDDILTDPGSPSVVALGGYGGMFLELIFFSNEIVHVTFPVSGGAGWLGYMEDWESRDPTIPSSPNNDEIIDEDVFWYIEPGANLEVNISRSVRLDFGVSKRFTQDLFLVATPDDVFENLNYYFTIKFGGF
jgi:hypothetical protein